MISLKQSPVCRLRKAVSLLCLTAILILAFSVSSPVQADAAPYYMVRQWTDQFADIQYFYIYDGYQGMPTYYEPTFFWSGGDRFISEDEEIKIDIYSPYAEPGKEESVAFHKYLLNNSMTWNRYTGYYHVDDPDYEYDSYYVFKIEGWNSGRSIGALLKHGPFLNSYGDTLELINVGNGNLVREQWDYIHDDLGCSFAVRIKAKSLEDGVTIGFKFTDDSGNPIECYN